MTKICPKCAQTLGTFWSHVQNWALFGHILDMCPNLGQLLVAYWAYTQTLGTFWSHFGHFLCLDRFWTCFGHIKDTFWSHFSKMCPYSHHSGVPWPQCDQNFGQPLDTFFYLFQQQPALYRSAEIRSFSQILNIYHTYILHQLRFNQIQGDPSGRWPHFVDFDSVVPKLTPKSKSTKYVSWPDGSPCMLLRYVVHLLFLYPTLP